MERKSPAMVESASTPMLAIICHKGTSDTPNLSMVATGAVMGNIVRTVHMVWFGKEKSSDENQSGEKPIIV